MAFWVYILRCSDASYYTGHTDDIDQRIAQHDTGAIPTCFTFKRRPLTMVFTQEFVTREEALVAEQRIKGWSRKKKEAMIQGDWAKVSRLAMNHQGTEATSVRPELVGGREPSKCVHGSTGSPRTVGVGSPRTAADPVRPEPVEGREPSKAAHGSTGSPRTAGVGSPRTATNPVRPELVEGRELLGTSRS
jgi:predicted GIY-YIG superfamily endonuclease